MDCSAFKIAIESAEKELWFVNEQLSSLEQLRAQLKQTILTLKRLIGEEALDDDDSITERIRTVIRSSVEPLTPVQVLEGLRAMNTAFTGKNPLASVTTILSRMATGKEIYRAPGAEV